jgi:DNA-binding response OmpR family regulator/DNA-binding CsgD family transcriptional regulator
MNKKKSKGIVLVADDSPDSLAMLNEALINEGYTIFVAMDGQQAINIAERISPDIIIMDAIMPNLDGFEACKQLKNNRELHDVPVIFMTGLSNSEDVIKGLEAGGVDYVNKPVNLDELIARIQVHLRNSRLTRSARNALDEIGQQSFACNNNGEITWCTDSTRTFLAQTGNAADRLENDLTSQIKTWLSHTPAKNSTLTIKGLNESLQIRYLGKLSVDEYLLRFVNTDEESVRLALREHFQLTDREVDVLLWIAKGKTNREIGQILSMSPRTVNKHLEQVYRKLQVDNRTSAAAICLQFLGGL